MGRVNMKIIKSAYFKKVLAFYLLLSTLPVLILGGFSYRRSATIIQEKVNKSNMQILNQTQMTVEENLKHIHNYYTLFAYSQLTLELINKSSEELDFESITWAQRQLGELMKIQTTIKNAYLINPEMDWFISNESMGTLADKINREQILEMIQAPQNIYWTYVEAGTNGESQRSAKEYMDVGNICMVIRFPFNQNVPQSGIIINLSQYQFNKILSQGYQEGRMMILDENNRVLYDDSKVLLGEDFGGQIYSKELVETENTQGFYETIVDGNKVGINYRKSPYNGWIYVSIYSINEITQDSRMIGWMTMLLCGVIMGLCLVVTAFGTKSIYNPIRNIYESVKKGISISGIERFGTDEMKYIGEGIHTLVDTKNKMEEQIRSQISQLKELFLIKLVQGELKENEIHFKLKSFGIEDPWKQICIISVQIDSIEDEELPQGDGDRDFIMIEIHRMIEEVIGGSIIFKPIFTRRVLTALVEGTQESPEDFRDQVYQYAETIQRRVKEGLKTNISIGISRPFSDLIGAPIAQKESIEALRGRINLGEQAILFFHEVQLGQSIKQSYPKNMENDLIDAISIGETDKAEYLIEMIIDQILKEELNFHEYQIYLTRLLIAIIRVLQDSGEPISNVFKSYKTIFEELNNLSNGEEIKKWFKNRIIRPIIMTREERSENAHKQILDEVIKIIHQEYDTDLTLEECASRLNYHPSYIWRIMRKEMDTSFSEYLAQYRLNMAKEWLEQTDLSISDIADRLKYNNSQNFIRYFKKLEGITPGSYRKEVRQKAGMNYGSK